MTLTLPEQMAVKSGPHSPASLAAMWNKVMNFISGENMAYQQTTLKRRFSLHLDAAWNESVMAGAPAAILDQEVMHGIATR